MIEKLLKTYEMHNNQAQLKGNYWSLAGVKMGAESPLSMQMILQVPLSLAAVLKEKIMDVIIT